MTKDMGAKLALKSLTQTCACHSIPNRDRRSNMITFCRFTKMQILS